MAVYDQLGGRVMSQNRIKNTGFELIDKINKHENKRRECFGRRKSTIIPKPAFVYVFRATEV